MVKAANGRPERSQVFLIGQPRLGDCSTARFLEGKNEYLCSHLNKMVCVCCSCHSSLSVMFGELTWGELPCSISGPES